MKIGFAADGIESIVDSFPIYQHCLSVKIGRSLFFAPLIFYPSTTSKMAKVEISGCLENENFRLIEADIRDQTAVEKACSGEVEVIIHLAAKAGVRPSINQPLLYADVNVNGTVTLLEAARKSGIDKLIFGSSSSVYGNNKKVPFAEDDNVDFPISPYAATKKAGELICHTYYNLHGIRATCLRFFTVYGPRQRPDLAIHKFARLIEQGRPIPVYGDGTMMRDFTYIDDIIDGTVAAIEQLITWHTGSAEQIAAFQIYNLGESKPLTVNELVAELTITFTEFAQRASGSLQSMGLDKDQIWPFTNSPDSLSRAGRYQYMATAL